MGVAEDDVPGRRDVEAVLLAKPLDLGERVPVVLARNARGPGGSR